jgi:hypothetical protein
VSVVFFLLGDLSASIFCANVLEHSVGSILMGHLNKKNNWEEMVGVFI